MAKTRNNLHGLTPREELFAEAKAAGMTHIEAYDAAGYAPNVTPAAKMSASYRVNIRENVQRRIRELQQQADDGAILNVQQIQAELTNIGLDEKNSKNVRLKALDQLAKTKGAYTDTVNVNASGGLTIAEKKEALKELLGE